MDSILTVDQDLVTNAIRTLAINTMTAYQSGTQLEWNDAELGVYLFYIFGEINKSEFQLIPAASLLNRKTFISWWEG
jgi:exportin-T